MFLHLFTFLSFIFLFFKNQLQANKAKIKQNENTSAETL